MLSNSVFSSRCDSSGSLNLTSLWWVPFYSVLLILLPVLTIVLTTIWLLWFLKRRAGLQRRGILTLVLISGVFVLSYTPIAALLASYAIVDPTDPAHKDYYDTFYRVSTFLNCLNYIANPVIYFVSISSFKQFVVGVVSRKGGSSPALSSTVVGNRSVRRLEEGGNPPSVR